MSSSSVDLLLLLLMRLILFVKHINQTKIHLALMCVGLGIENLKLALFYYYLCTIIVFIAILNSLFYLYFEFNF